MALRASLTSIGSWPGDSVEKALDWAFEFDLPALPELPGLGPEEDMLGSFLSAGPAALTAFLERVDRRRPLAAKMQCIGPVTLLELARRGAPRLIGFSEAELIERFRARARRDVLALRDRGTQPFFFLDEPLLFAAPGELARFRPLIVELQELGAKVGLHSCGPVPWTAVLALGFDRIAFDATTLARPGPNPSELELFGLRGGRLIPGAVSLTDSASAAALVQRYGADFDLSFACGLAGAAVPEVPGLISSLHQFRSRLKTSKSQHLSK